MGLWDILEDAKAMKTTYDLSKYKKEFAEYDDEKLKSIVRNDSSEAKRFAALTVLRHRGYRVDEILSR